MVNGSPTETEVLREYYANSDYLNSPEGILKIFAILGCLASGVLFLAGGGCAGAWWLAAGGASVALVASALAALQLSATLLGAPLAVPHAALYADMVGSSVLGALLLVSGALSAGLCELRGRLALVHAPLALANALLLAGSAVATHRAVTRRWDAARGPRLEPRRPPPVDQDV